MPKFASPTLCGTLEYDTDKFELAVCVDFLDSTPSRLRISLHRNWKGLKDSIEEDYPECRVYIWGVGGTKPGSFLHLQIFIPRGVEDFDDSVLYDLFCKTGVRMNWESRCPC